MRKLSVAVSAEDHSQGDAHAQVTLVEYGDYQCPHCAIAQRVVKQLQRHYGDKLRFVFRNFPLEMHPMAEPAAEAAEFAGAQRKFWQMHDAIFAHQKSLSEAMLVETAEGLGLDGAQAEAAILDGQFGDRIERDVRGGEKSGVHGTPTFFINDSAYEGAWEFEGLVEAIDGTLA